MAKVGRVEPSAIGSFLRTVLRSGVLKPADLHAALRTAPSGWRSQPRVAANHLVKTGKLTRFQANKLLYGASLGLILGPYEILAQIGKGGMGSVYLARDSQSRKLLAVKVLPPKRAKQSDKLVARFLREMDICRRVFHPYLTRTYNVGAHEGVYYIAMEYIPGKTLYHTVLEKGPLTVGQAARIFSDVSLGLEHAHGQGLIHRDMKPSNIMVLPDGHAKVLDLGLALIEGEGVTDRTITGGQGYVLGTMDYLAPEQAEDSVNVDPRSDVYSLGCTLYFALTGRPPFPGGNTLQKILRHRCDEPTPINAINPSIDRHFCPIVKKMMAKKKEDRYSSAAGVRAALQDWIRKE